MGTPQAGGSRVRVWWLDRPMRSKGFLVLALPLFMLFVAAMVFFLASVRFDVAQDAVRHAREAQERLGTVGNLVLEGETGIRGFLATGDRVFLETTARARERLPAALDELAAAVGDDPGQAGRVARVRSVLAAGYQTVEPTGTAADGPAAVEAWLREQKVATDEIGAVLAAMAAREDRLLAENLAERDGWRDWMRIGTGAALALGIVGGLGGMAAFTMGVTRRLERLRVDTDGLRAGEQVAEVDWSRDEIGVLSRRLAEVAHRWLLWQSQAEAAREAADCANRAKSEFLSRMSHELRTPLNAMLGFAQLLELDVAPDQQDSVQQIRRAGRHLLDLINEVLDISRIEAGQLSLSPEPVRISDLIEETLTLMAPLAAARGITLDSPPTARCGCHARADRQRAKQVLLNLLSNAVKYNHRGGSVSVRCRALDEKWVAIEVADTGIGIPDHHLSRLFTPFERLGAAQSDIEGTGVGLALSLRLAHAMDGDLQVESKIGQGTTFRFQLPAAAQPVPEEVPATGMQHRSEVAPGRGAVRTVLSIEDNLANTRLLEQIIARRPGWAIVTAGSGQLGLDLAVANPPDLILLDLHLPDIGGSEVLHRLKATPATAATPVVIVSADATSGQVERLRAAGAADYLTKPIDVAAVLNLLDQVAAHDHDTERS